MDTIATNAAASVLLASMLEAPEARGNNARFVYGSEAARTLYPDWDDNADTVASTLRSSIAAAPEDEGLRSLVDDLLAQSAAFRARWARDDVRVNRSGAKRLFLADVGMLQISFEVIAFPGHPGLVGIAFLPADAATAEKLARLG